MPDDVNIAHKEKMVRRDEAFERKMARATREKGLLIVYTGAGKGKTTAALGLALRALGQGMRVGIVQFIKGAIPTGEAALLSEWNERVEIHTLGEGFTWKTQDRERDVATAQRAWQKAVELLRDPSFDMVILDELKSCSAMITCLWPTWRRSSRRNAPCCTWWSRGVMRSPRFWRWPTSSRR